MENLNEISEDCSVTIPIIEDVTPSEKSVLVEKEARPLENNEQRKEKMFSMTFLLLIQGQFVSLIGNYIYEIALGFWVLATTGSTALMGTLMATSVLPSVLIGPFAGVIVDRFNRKVLLVLTQIIRGTCVLLIASAALLGFLKIWMVFCAAVLLGAAGAFYHPSTNSVIPEIVPRSRLTNANSILGLANSSSNIIGNSCGGFLYNLVGAPIMFLINGLCFLASGVSMIFTKIPNKKNIASEQHFITDLKSGLSFAWKLKGLRYTLFITAALNFFMSMSTILILPLFQKTQSLGAARYGIAMAFITAGAFIGMIVMSMLRIKPKNKSYFLLAGLFMMIVFFISAILLMNNFVIMCIMFMLAGFFQTFPNVLIVSIMQEIVPQDMMGKVFALLFTMSQGLSPIAMALGGVLGQFIYIPTVILSSYSMFFICVLPMAFNRNFKRFVNFDLEKQVLEELM